MVNVNITLFLIFGTVDISSGRIFWTSTKKELKPVELKLAIVCRNVSELVVFLYNKIFVKLVK